MNALLAIAVIVILAGILLLILTLRRREQLSLPVGEIIYEDTPEQPGQLLISSVLKLAGKPDALIQQGQMIIPVERKTGRTPDSPYPGHVMQLAVYCHLVEQTYKVRPDYGIIRYDQQEFRIEYTRELEQELGRIVQEMQAKRRAGEIHRNHSHRAKCAACGFLEVCSERLDREYQQRFDLTAELC